MKKNWLRLGTCVFFSFSSLITLEVAVGQTVSPLFYENAVFEYLDNRDPESPRPSPNSSVSLQIGSTRVMIAYGSPGVKGRKFFGSGGRIPNGFRWRMGANEATTITFTGDVLIEEEHEIPEGAYSLWAIVGEKEWIIIFNRENNLWGRGQGDSWNYQESEDILRISVPVHEAEFQERLIFRFEDIDTENFSASVLLHWENIKVSFKVIEP